MKLSRYEETCEKIKTRMLASLLFLYWWGAFIFLFSVILLSTFGLIFFLDDVPWTNGFLFAAGLGFISALICYPLRRVTRKYKIKRLRDYWLIWASSPVIINRNFSDKQSKEIRQALEETCQSLWKIYVVDKFQHQNKYEFEKSCILFLSKQDKIEFILKHGEFLQ